MKTIIILLAFASVSVAEFDLPPEYVRTSLGDSIDVATMKILKEAYDTSTEKNVVSSPLGLMMLLSLYNVGAGPGAKSEITNFLGGTDAKQVSEPYKDLFVKLAEMNTDYITIANKVSVSDKYTLDKNFATAARDFRSEFDKLDFTKPEEAAAKINQWAAEKTKGHITSPVSKDALSPDTAAALFNVIFFKGHWHVPFKVEETKEKDFYVSNKTVVKKPMMHLLNPLDYTESKEIGAKMIALPYKEKGFRMVVVLPDEKDGLSSVLEKAAKTGLLSDVFKLNSFGRDVDLDMPKFDIRTKLNFNEILPKIGVNTLFAESATGLVQNLPVKLSKVMQEAFIKVDEEGSTAGAFTGGFFRPVSAVYVPPPPLKFTVDHSFLYLILFEDKILFAGTYSQ